MNESAFPAAFESRMQVQLADEWSAFKLSHTEPSPIAIRLNPRKKIMTGPLDPVPWTTHGKYLAKRPVFTLDPLFHAGAYYVQDASSMFLEQIIRQCVDVNRKLKILDLSAAPGGKSTHVLSLINNESLLVANEVIRSRASILSENIQKWGYPNCLVTNNDAADFSNLHGFFDVIIVDAPCSGEGLFRKDQSSMKEWSAENVSLCASRQKRILHDVWPALKENGLLIYSTCTYSEMENEDNLFHFREQHACEFLEIWTDSSWNIGEAKKGNVTAYKFFPHKVKGEGFFVSVLRKKEQVSGTSNRNKPRLNPASRKHSEPLKSWLTDPNAYSFFQHQDLIFVLNTQLSQDVDRLLQHLRFIYGGTNVATAKHEKLVPEHALAVSTIVNQDQFEKIDVDEKVALQYLRREAISLTGAKKGFNLLTFETLPLGFVNVLENRVNNMYPQEWRIRMG
jgi:16S rRNA C967 or C1407 C5-methylase (RsmB/RsmF family)/NOL1/NOP2/fmu family ribosome biogenesis protein